MNIQWHIEQLENNREIFSRLFSRISEHSCTWKTDEKKWCPLEIICHLYDEETEDFRVRIAHVFKNPKADPPQIHPVKWVLERKYLEQNFSEKITAFLAERDQSVLWLSGLDEPPWDNIYEHPRFGPMSARFFLENWLAHDLLHIKQITRWHYDYLNANSERGIEYAGKWT